MDPLKSFRELIFNTKQTDSGTIISIVDGVISVSTSQGVSTATGDTSLFKIGDSVIIKDGVITSKSNVEDDLPVHEV